MRVLKDLVTRVPRAAGGGNDGDGDDDRKDNAAREESDAPTARAVNAQHQLSCILTAYELLSGQGAYPYRPPGALSNGTARSRASLLVHLPAPFLTREFRRGAQRRLE